MTEPGRPKPLYDGQALLDRLIAAKLAGGTDSEILGGARYWFRSNEQAANVAFDVAHAFFGPLLAALREELATLQEQRSR